MNVWDGSKELAYTCNFADYCDGISVIERNRRVYVKELDKSVRFNFNSNCMYNDFRSEHRAYVGQEVHLGVSENDQRGSLPQLPSEIYRECIRVGLDYPRQPAGWGAVAPTKLGWRMMVLDHIRDRSAPGAHTDEFDAATISLVGKIETKLAALLRDAGEK